MPFPAEEGPLFAAIEVASDVLEAAPPQDVFVEIGAGGATVRLPIDTDANRVFEIVVALKGQ